MASTPTEVMRKLIDDVSNDRWDGLHLLYANDTDVRHPFAADHSRHLVGRDALRAHFAHFADSGWRLRARDVVMNDAADPEVVIGEFVYDVRLPYDERQHQMVACFIWRVRDGLVVEARDYLDTPKPRTHWTHRTKENTRCPT